MRILLWQRSARRREAALSIDETVATVDSSGKVHIVGAGSTRITAISAETADYQETEASYMLRVERRQVEIPDADTTVFVYNGME